MRRFCLQRNVDETGISGTGRVLDGVLFRNGQVAWTWNSPHVTMTISPSMENFLALHVDGHPGCAELVWVDEEHEPKNGIEKTTPPGNEPPPSSG